MTTIACDGKTMTSDGLITSGDMIIQSDCQKIFRLNDGRIVGFAGNAYDWEPVVKFFNGELKDWPKCDHNIAILVLDKSGQCTLYDSHGKTFARPTPTAIGTGRAYAIGAMRAGASTVEAVEIASSLDTLSGGCIRSMSIFS